MRFDLNPLPHCFIHSADSSPGREAHIRPISVKSWRISPEDLQIAGDANTGSDQGGESPGLSPSLR
jgi:hypothetical protein